MTDTVRFEVREGVGLLTLNRPRQLNALNRAPVGGIGAVLQDPALADCRALILTGEGNRAFAAGADIAEMADLSATEAADCTDGAVVCAVLERRHQPEWGLKLIIGRLLPRQGRR